jgi:hypothetical protein
MKICRHPENSNQTTDVFTFHLSKLGFAFAQLLSRSSPESGSIIGVVQFTKVKRILAASANTREYPKADKGFNSFLPTIIKFSRILKFLLLI